MHPIEKYFLLSTLICNMDVQSYNLNASIYLDLLQNKLSDQAKKPNISIYFSPHI